MRLCCQEAPKAPQVQVPSTQVAPSASADPGRLPALCQLCSPSASADLGQAVRRMPQDAPSASADPATSPSAIIHLVDVPVPVMKNVTPPQPPPNNATHRIVRHRIVLARFWREEIQFKSLNSATPNSVSNILRRKNAYSITE